ncbi:BLUF domain-containing protein [Aquimarina spongiae]|uniref:Sensors of blue-light using FAD n=1 Tax=Aquimarina spongiae TaxID=570521 RepID=A0A1M6DU46_9FLAO|nr:BLUF domain-containing protein [Aquimarina spongiae]SHI76721.1 Sensors of blue-light using FAD [Aquimarina spongiae]
MFLTICYISNASEKLTDQDIETLLLDAKVFNNQNNISGILIYSDFTFFQVIEGEYNIIKSLFERIEQDYRHYNILKILEIKSEKKEYHKYNTNFITHNKKKANQELLKVIENNQHIFSQKLHNFIVYQSKSLMSIY